MSATGPSQTRHAPRAAKPGDSAAAPAPAGEPPEAGPAAPAPDEVTVGLVEEEVMVVPVTAWRPGMAIEAALRHQTVMVRMPVVGSVTLPNRAHLVWYAGLLALTAVEIIEWPTALLMGLAKGLSDSQHHQLLRELGDALEAGA